MNEEKARVQNEGRATRLAVLLLVAVVIFLFAIFGSRGFFMNSGVFEHTRCSRVGQDLSTFQSALNLFRMNAGRYPTSEEGLMALVERPVGYEEESWEQTLRQEQLDPWQNPYGYEFPSKHGSDSPDVFSAGADMVFGTEDDIGNWDDD